MDGWMDREIDETCVDNGPSNYHRRSRDRTHKQVDEPIDINMLTMMTVLSTITV